MQEQTDLAIIGRGVLGQSIAYRAKTTYPDCRISVIGNPDNRASASAASGMMMGCFGEVTKYTFLNETGQAKFDLSYQAHQSWGQYLAELNSLLDPSNQMLMNNGTFVALNSQGGYTDSENYAAMIQTLKRYREPFEEVDHIPGVKSYANLRPLKAIFLHNEGSIDSNAFLGRLEQINRGLGVNFLDQNVTEIQSQGMSLQFKNGDKINPEKVVLAAGSFSWPLIEPLVEPGSVIPIVAGSGVAVLTRRVIGEGFKEVVRSVNRAGSCGLHLIPFGDGREYIGATNVIFKNPEHLTHLGVCHFLIQSAIDQLNQDLAFSRILEWRIGNRPVSLDTYPTIGPIPDLPKLYLASGTYRDGFHASPTIANMVVNEFLDEKPSEWPQFNPARPYQYAFSTADEAANEFANQAISSMYESGLQLPRFNYDDEFAERYKANALKLHHDLRIDFGLNPDIVNFLTLSSKDKPSDQSWVSQYLHNNKKNLR